MSKLAKFAHKAIDMKKLPAITGGGTFCDIYLGYTQAQGTTPRQGVMNYAIFLDQVADNYGTNMAMALGGNFFVNRFG